jgi:hypothetical protein
LIAELADARATPVADRTDAGHVAVTVKMKGIR